MKQGLPAWVGVAFCLRSIKTPALKEEKTRPKLPTRNEEGSVQLGSFVVAFWMLKYG